MLEHAFESILEAGEVPRLPFFTEMACQAIIRRDYEKAVNIFNTMGHAPYQVGFQEWVDLFERNRDRMDQAAVQELKDELASHELRKELTLTNLWRALEFICDDSVDSIASISTGMVNAPKAGWDVRYDDTSLSRGNSTNTEHSYQLTSSRIETGRGSDEASASSDNCSEKDHVRAPTRVTENFDHDWISKRRACSGDGEWDCDGDEFDIEMLFPSSGDDDTEESDTPSAYEILESWKKK